MRRRRVLATIGAFLLAGCGWQGGDEETAIEEYESEVDLSTNVVGDPVDREVEIGDETVVLVGGPASVRVIFRDVNAFGLVDYEADGLLEIESLPESPEIVALARAMHERWRD